MSGSEGEVAAAILSGGGPERLGLRQGVVVTTDPATWSVAVNLSGDVDSTATARVIGWLFPSAGDTVWLLRNGTDLLALAVAASQPRVLDTWRATTLGTWYGPGSSEAVPNASGDTATVSGVLTAGYRYRVTVAMPLFSNVGTDTGLLRIREDDATGTTRAFRRCGFLGTSITDVFLLTCDFDAAASGLQVFAATVQRSAGTGNMTVSVTTDKTIDMSLELLCGPSLARTG